jgi:hypothetical protein
VAPHFNSRSATILFPTDEAWIALLLPARLNETTVLQLTPQWLDRLQIHFLTYLAYNEIPNITLTTTNITDGMNLPTMDVSEGLNLTTHVDPTTHNIAFIGFVDAPDTAANTTNRAAVLFPDIPVSGLKRVVLHVVDKVLLPENDLAAPVLVGVQTNYQNGL